MDSDISDVDSELEEPLNNGDGSDINSDDNEDKNSENNSGQESDSGASDNNSDDDDDNEDGSQDSEAELGEDKRGEDSSANVHIGDDLEKARHTVLQIKLWEDLLKLRINLQKAMVVVNQLPQPAHWSEFLNEGGERSQHAAVSSRVQLKRLLDVLFQLQTRLLASNPETKNILQSVAENHDDGKQKDSKRSKMKVDDEDDEEITSESEASEKDEAEDNGAPEESDEEQRDEPNLKKRKMTEYPELLAKRHRAFQKYRDNTIQKWDDKTRIMSGKVGKGFSAFDQSAVKQIQQTLSDKERLISRTHVNRLGHHVLGKQTETDAAAVAPDDPSDDQQEPTVSRDPLKDADDEIFDDNDFYHHILREFIQHKNSYDPVVLTKQWLEIQQYRKKAKKNIDRKASKSRKTRYNVHKPLVNFMAPYNNPDLWLDEQRDDLFKNLFGKSQAA